MSFPILPQKSAWSCATSMLLDTDRATAHTMASGAKSRSNSARRRVFRRLPWTPRTAISPRLTDHRTGSSGNVSGIKSSMSPPSGVRYFQRLAALAAFICLLLVGGSCTAGAQNQLPPSTSPNVPPPPGYNPPGQQDQSHNIKAERRSRRPARHRHRCSRTICSGPETGRFPCFREQDRAEDFRLLARGYSRSPWAW